MNIKILYISPENTVGGLSLWKKAQLIGNKDLLKWRNKDSFKWLRFQLIKNGKYKQVKKIEYFNEVKVKLSVARAR